MSSKKGLGRGLGAIVSLAPVQEDGAARIDEAIRASAGPSVLTLSGDSFDDMVRASASGRSATPPTRRDAQPMCPPPGTGFAPPLDLKVGATTAPRTGALPAMAASLPPVSHPGSAPVAMQVVATVEAAAMDVSVVDVSVAHVPVCPSNVFPADSGTVVCDDAAFGAAALSDPEEPGCSETPATVSAGEAPSAAETPVDSEAMAAARRAVQYSLFDAPAEIAPRAVEAVETAAPVAVPATAASAEPCAASPASVPAVESPSVADESPAFTDDVLYFDDTILVSEEGAPELPVAESPASPPTVVLPAPTPAPAAFADDSVLIDDVFIDDAVGGFVLPDVEME